MEKNLIFLVDDNELFIRAFSKQAEMNSNLEVKAFASGDDCLEALDLRPEAIVLDYHMKGSTGVEVLRKLNQRKWKGIAVMLSGEQDPTLIKECLDEGAAKFFPKSMQSPNEVIEFLTEEINRREPQSSDGGILGFWKNLKSKFFATA